MTSEAKEKDDGKKTSVLKTVAKIAFSHLGLCVLVILYCMLGGILFELLEEQNEIWACREARKEYDEMENETLFSLLDVVLNNPPDSVAMETQMVGVLESFRNNTLSIGYDGSWCEDYGGQYGPPHEWNYPGSLFFSVTVITTVGYGHIAPKTIWGRLLCISYAMLGIPLMLLFLANIGDVLADVFRYIYFKVFLMGCLKRKLPTGPHVVKSRPRMEDEPELYHGRSTEVFTNLNQATRGTEVKQRLIKSNPNPNINIQSLDSATLENRRQAVLQRMNSQKEKLIVDDEWDDEDEREWQSITSVSVPVTVSMGIIALYIFGGAVLFKYWEGWDLLQASYFCFITLSSIGLGDITPGRDFKDPTANARLIIGSIYAIFGMAILSMCFSLMQEELVSKFRWLGRKMGIMAEGVD